MPGHEHASVVLPGFKWHGQGIYSPTKKKPDPPKKQIHLHLVLIKKVQSRVFGTLCAKKHKADFCGNNLIRA